MKLKSTFNYSELYAWHYGIVGKLERSRVTLLQHGIYARARRNMSAEERPGEAAIQLYIFERFSTPNRHAHSSAAHQASSCSSPAVS